MTMVVDNNFKQFTNAVIIILPFQYFNDDFDTRVDPKGNEYYWMVGNMVDEDTTFDSDSYVVKNDYASLSPLGFNLSSSKEIEEMKKILD